MSITNNLKEIKTNLPESCLIVAVSKTKSSSDIMQVYESGHRDFGENKVQELTQKAEELPKDIRWHMIGHLQRNKVKYIAPFIHLIHSVDSEKLLQEINKQALKNDRVIDCLLQIHIAEEESKFGLDSAEAEQILNNSIDEFKNVQIKGLMGMATNTKDIYQVRKEFKFLNNLFHSHKESKKENVTMEWLSMGMSGDYLIAAEQGSNMLRIGSAIFGARNY